MHTRLHRPSGSLERNAALTSRYRIDTAPVGDLVRHPPRFQVRVRRHRLALMVLRELVELTGPGRLRVALSRPCVYGVFSRAVGGLMPRHDLCVGCLRCTTQYPELVAIHPHPERPRLGDSYVTPDFVDTILYEARTGRVPVRGAGYRGPFGGEGWDGMWTDMSEIVRPTRDGIHGREYISTSVDIGAKPGFLQFDEAGSPIGPEPQVFAIQVPFLFEPPPAGRWSRRLREIAARAAAEFDTLVLLPLDAVVADTLAGPHIVPIVGRDQAPLLDRLAWQPRLIELEGWDASLFGLLRRRRPDSLVAVRLPMDADLLPLVQRDVRVFHLLADYHGRANGHLAMDAIRATHERLVASSVREEVTLLGGGGLVMAEHVAKAIIVGLDVAVLDTVLCVALQARFTGPCVDRARPGLAFSRLRVDWGASRLRNLTCSWRDQLLEVLGAMGLREVRRLRGELGRSMLQRELEREAFEGIAGF